MNSLLFGVGGRSFSGFGTNVIEYRIGNLF